MVIKARKCIAQFNGGPAAAPCDGVRCCVTHFGQHPSASIGRTRNRLGGVTEHQTGQKGIFFPPWFPLVTAGGGVASSAILKCAPFFLLPPLTGRHKGKREKEQLDEMDEPDVQISSQAIWNPWLARERVTETTHSTTEAKGGWGYVCPLEGG